MKPDAAQAPDAVPPPIDAPAYSVRGTAYGVLVPLSIELVHTGGRELLSILDDGPFEFPIELRMGSSYAVEFVGEPPCVLVGASGVVDAVDAAIELACEGVFLQALTISGTTAPQWDVQPAKTAYEANVSILQQHVTVTAVTAHPESMVTINGFPGENGAASAASAAMPLDMGENQIEVAVTPPGGSTRVYHVVVRRAADIAQAVYGKASNTDAGDFFGTSVALAGDTLAVGAHYEDSTATGTDGGQTDNAASNSGAVYVFRRTGTTWAQEAYLKASNTGAGDRFGHSVTLAGDTLAVGAYEEDSAATGTDGDHNDNAASNSGAVYVFRRTGTTWAQEAYLKASNTGAGDHFGKAVAVAGDTLAVGAFHEDSATTGINGDQSDNSASQSGAVYVFRRTGSTWAQEAYIKASNTGAGDFFGYSVALGGDTLAVGAYLEGSAATGIDGDQSNNLAGSSGAVYVFRRTGSTWAQKAYIKASNTDKDDNFGHSVALAGDTLAVGAFYEDSAATGINGDQTDNSTSKGGAVYVFRRTGSTWAQEAYLKASNTDADDHFGKAVTVAGDTLAVGAHWENSATTGINGDQSDNAASNSGAVYVFRRTGTTWAQEAYLKASTTDAEDKFGISVALAGDTLAVGAYEEDSAATGTDGGHNDNAASNSGAVYVFH